MSTAAAEDDAPPEITAFDASRWIELERLRLVADAACYAAKNAGRGRVEVHHSDPKCEESGRFELSKLKLDFDDAG